MLRRWGHWELDAWLSLGNDAEGWQAKGAGASESVVRERFPLPLVSILGVIFGLKRFYSLVLWWDSVQGVGGPKADEESSCSHRGELPALTPAIFTVERQHI